MPDISEGIKKLVRHPDRVKFIRYGQHRSTNEYSKIKTCLPSWHPSVQHRPVHSNRLASKSTNIEKVDEGLTQDEFLKIQYGEIAHHILQTSCRGMVRRCVGYLPSRLSPVHHLPYERWLRHPAGPAFEDIPQRHDLELEAYCEPERTYEDAS
jgi:hypothetical protein